MKKINRFLILAVFFIVMITACSNQYDDQGHGSFSINIGSSGARAAPEGYEKFTYIIRLTDGPAEDIEKTITGFGQVNFSVPVGQWTISVEARNDDHVLKGVGSAAEDIRPGPNGAKTISMKKLGVIKIRDTLSDNNIIIIDDFNEDGEQEGYFPLKISGESTISITGSPDIDRYEWYIKRELTWDKKTGKTITLNASDFDPEFPLLTLVVWKDGLPYYRTFEYESTTTEVGVSIQVTLPNMKDDIGITLYKSDGSVIEDIITITGSETINVTSDYDSYSFQWYIASRDDLIWNEETGSITLNAEDFDPATTYILTLTVWVEDVPYSTDITFKVK